MDKSVRKQELFVQATYDLEKRDIFFQMRCEDGAIRARITPENFARMWEYLDMFWKSYCECKKKGEL